MKSLIAILACAPLLPIQAQATEASLKVGDVIITRGMSEESLRAELSDAYGFSCSDPEPGVDVVSCALSVKDGTGTHAHILLQNGHVLTASQGYKIPPTAYDAFMVLHELLSQLTNGQDTCAVVSVYGGSPKQLVIALPEKYIVVLLHELDQHQVDLQVGLRQNPTPDIGLADCWPNRPPAR